MAKEQRADAWAALDSLAGLDNATLMIRLQRSVTRDNELEAELLALIAEVDGRKLYVPQGFSSMFRFATCQLGLSEDMAYRRITAARACRRFPLLVKMLGRGKLHLAGICLLAPHLTADNHQQLIDAAAGKTKRAIEKLLAAAFPKPDVRDSVRKLPARRPAVATPENASAADGVLDADDPPECDGDSRDRGDNCRQVLPIGTPTSSTPERGNAADMPPAKSRDSRTLNRQGPRRDAPPSSRDRVEPLAESRYKVVLTADQELVDKLQQARELSGPRVAANDLASIFNRALDLLVTDLENKKHAVKKAVTKPKQERETQPAALARAQNKGDRDSEETKNMVELSCGDSVACKETRGTTAQGNKERSRSIPRQVKREVYERDQGQCAYVSAEGQRCQERWGLEYHHKQPFARGGPHTCDNMELRCRAHQALAAERDYGVDFMRQWTEPQVRETRARYNAAGTLGAEDSGPPRRRGPRVQLGGGVTAATARPGPSSVQRFAAST